MPLGYGLSSLVHGEGLKDVIDSVLVLTLLFSMALSPTVMIGQLWPVLWWHILCSPAAQ